MTAILGLNAYHADASAALFVNGKLVAAAEEERFRRIKHWAGFPVEAIRYCLAEAGLSLGQIHHVAMNSDPRANRLQKITYTLRRRPGASWLWQRIRNAGRRRSVREELSAAFGGQTFQGQVYPAEHHLCHLASAYLASPFAEAAAASVDGFGDFASAAWGMGTAGKVRVDNRVLFPHSLGTFYEALTQYLGFPHYGDEYKVMGLAPYGKPSCLAEVRELVKLAPDGTYRLGLSYFRHHQETVTHQWNNCAPEVGTLYTPALEKLLGTARKENEPLTQRHKDIAHSVQLMYEDAFFHLLNSVHARYGCDRLALAGGCAMNSVANGKIRQRTPFRAVYIQAASGDAGGAIGAALVLASKLSGGDMRWEQDHAYWGPAYSDDQCAEVLMRARERMHGHSIERVTDEQQLCERVVRALAVGRVVGWFQGRMEWGPRALGNRSILADPRRPDMKDILNQKVKRRESFRPFAPSILRERVSEWFEQDDDVPFMSQVFQVRAERRGQIPAVTHVDGSGRLQTVQREANPRYYRLIETFGRSTGVPILLNTSFNENEPVVCRPEEALNCFLRTDMDMLVLGSHVLERSK